MEAYVRPAGGGRLGMSRIEVTKFYVRHREGLPETEMQYAAWRGMWSLNVETAPFEKVEDLLEKNDLGPTVGVAGHIADVWMALREIGKPVPDPLDYPEQLSHFLGRSVWLTTLGKVREARSDVFVKPVTQKLFSGFVQKLEEGAGAAKLDLESRLRVIAIPDDTPVWASEVVDFVSEWRAFVLRGNLVGLKHYKGDPFEVPDRKVVMDAISAMGRGAPQAYCLDFGVRTDGPGSSYYHQTLLVEVTDAHSVGHYGLSSVTYARMLSARWCELAS